MKAWRKRQPAKFWNRWPSHSKEHLKIYRQEKKEMLARSKAKYRASKKYQETRKRYESHPGVKRKMIQKNKLRRLRGFPNGWAKKKCFEKLFVENLKKYGVLTCELCSHKMPKKQATIEHFTPCSRGGLHVPENTGLAHASCNFKKKSKTLNEFLVSKN